MKSKVFGLKILMVVLAVLTAGACFGILTKPKTTQEPYVAHSTKVELVNGSGVKEEYSALFEGNVIFSAEKVYVPKDDTDDDTDAGAWANKTFIARSGEAIEAVSNYEFGDIAKSTGVSKTVVDNGEYIIFENQKLGTAGFAINSSSDKQEALMISLGAYYFEQVTEGDEEFDVNDAEVKIHDQNNGAKITELRVIQATRDGQPLFGSNEWIIREYSDDHCFDFVYLIKQDKDNKNEGFYEFVFSYTINGIRVENVKFEFYIINRTSFTGDLIKDGDLTTSGYSAEPIVGWLDKGETNPYQFGKVNDQGEGSSFFIGENGYGVNDKLSYPTITYDYTRYKLKYTHTLNNSTTEWSFDWRRNGEYVEMAYTSVNKKEGKTISDTFALLDYEKDNAVNLVTILLTEPGNYRIDYETYFNASNGKVINIGNGRMSFAIEGLVAEYSKEGVNSARLEYLEIASVPDNNVDLFIPNGYDKSEARLKKATKEDNVGFVYSLVSSENLREGIAVKYEGALANSNIEGLNVVGSDAYNMIVGPVPDDDSYSGLSEMDQTNYNSEKFDDVFGNIKYVKLNQAPVSIAKTNVIDSTSFYIYSQLEIKRANIFGEGRSYVNGVEAKKLTNSTTFNKTGYYLVFVNVKINDNSTKWQVFAFQLQSKVSAIKVKAENGAELKNDFTNQSVEISWNIPGIFDRKVKVSYYTSTDKNITSEQIQKNSPNPISDRDIEIVSSESRYKTVIGKDIVAEGSFLKILVKLEGEEGASETKMFTIDRQQISGVKSYLVEENYFGSSVYYALKTDQNGDCVEIKSSITDSLSTIMWNPKLSGAKITATYDFIPFGNKFEVKYVTYGQKIKESLTTGYGLLENKIEGRYFEPVENIAEINQRSILDNQGLYLFKIQDDAGNGCLYMFIIDKTGNYFKIPEGEHVYYKNNLIVYGSDVNYSLGDYKMIDLTSAITKANSNDLFLNYVKAFINSKSREDFISREQFASNEGFKYYQGEGNNVEKLTNLFISTGGEQYLAVENKGVQAYDVIAEKDNNSIKETSGTITDKNKIEGQQYYKVILYAKSESQTYSTTAKRGLSNVTIEINKDNSLLFVHHGAGSSLTSQSQRLDTSSGMTYIKASALDYVAITWKPVSDNGSYEVNKVTLQKYELNLNNYSEDTYFYKKSGDPIEISSKATADTSDASRVIYNNGKNKWSEGLYVVTREYKGAENSENFGEDVAIAKYYFIIDRKAILDSTELIEFRMLEDGDDELAVYKTFSGTGMESANFVGDDGNGNELREKVNIYFTTNKVPVTLRVPAGKFDRSIGSSSGYQAGKLNVQIFYMEGDYNQLPTEKNYIIFDSSKNLDKNGQVKISDGYIEIDLSVCLSSESQENVGRLIGSDKSWMFLPGIYIVRVFDNVITGYYSDTGVRIPNEQYIGFKIEAGNKGPQGEENAQATIFNGYDSGRKSQVTVKSLNSDELNFEYHATVSQEYLEIAIPKYDPSSLDPMIDPEYLVVEQYYGNTADKGYFNYSEDKEDPEKIVEHNDGFAYGVKLNTFLRDGGKIDSANFEKELKYVIKLRYKIGNDADDDRFESCYVYYDESGKAVKYCYATITITIDRQAPLANITELNKNDAFVEQYCASEEFDVDCMTENAHDDYGYYVYFKHQYSAYYQNEREDIGQIYIYQVKSGTEFKIDDVNVVYYHKIDDEKISTYQLETKALTGVKYEEIQMNGFKQNTTYGAILQDYGYYEIVEEDMAGNTTQYVVHYMSGDDANIQIPISVQYANKDMAEEGVIDGEIILDIVSNHNKELHLYSIDENNTVVENKDNNFIVELFKGSETNPIFSKLTTQATDYKELVKDLIGKIKEMGYGSFRIVLKARKVLNKQIQNPINYTEKEYIINLYDAENLKKITIDDLIVNSGDGYKLVFGNACVRDAERDLVFYASKITIKHDGKIETYYGEYDYTQKLLKFYDSADGKGIVEYRFVNTGAVYQIDMGDMLGNPSTYRFSPGGKDFYKVEFENPNHPGEWGDYYYRDDLGVYYGYTNARVVYDDGVFEGFYNNNYYESGQILKVTKYGENVSYIIEILESESLKSELTYTIQIITDLGKEPTLRDYSTGEDQDALVQYDNFKFDSERVKSQKSLTGIMNLQWSVSEHKAYEYKYVLHEELLDGTYRIGEDGTEGIKLNPIGETGTYTINTLSDSAGRYVFEIIIYGADGMYLGNRIYAFEVQKSTDRVYYVRNEEKVAVINNSTFYLGDLDENAQSILIKKGLNSKVSYPLYVTNENLEIVPVGSLVESEEIYVNEMGLSIYEISKGSSFRLFIGILKIDTLRNINSVEIAAPEVSEVIALTTEFDITKNTAEGGLHDVVLKINFEVENNPLLKKNKLFLDVYYDQELVTSHELVDTIIDSPEYAFVYKEQGNGKFSYIVRDLAGNKYVYTNGSDEIKLSIVREVVVKLNGQLPIENGYYNDSVTMEILEKENYVPGSIKIEAKLNGETYYVGSRYVFNEYGTYRVKVSAKYTNNKNEDVAISNELVFTVLNRNEVVKSIDLSCLGKCEITKVMVKSSDFDEEIEDKTAEFLNMLETSGQGLIVSYEMVKKYSQELNVSADKVYFTITYSLFDGIYPEREYDLEICLNDEKPSIDCSLERGGKTTKGFTITYNGAILYQQIGEAEIIINGEVAARIDINSSNYPSTISRSFQSSGAGDYYVQIVSSSGEVWDSFKVTIKEPLNVWAIVIIVVVTLVVASVVITIIVLRRRMRIR